MDSQQAETMKKHKKVIIGGIIVLVALLVLGYAAFMGGNTYYYEVGEFLDKGNAVVDQTSRVSGLVAEGTYKDGFTLHFKLDDATGRDASFPVVYNGSVPDTFKVGQQVVIEGKLMLDGRFEASQIIIKCASKYEPAE
jgi:cytochrome c-type biogenesis protein CcmE